MSGGLCFGGMGWGLWAGGHLDARAIPPGGVRVSPGKQLGPGHALHEGTHFFFIVCQHIGECGFRALMPQQLLHQQSRSLES